MHDNFRAVMYLQGMIKFFSDYQDLIQRACLDNRRLTDAHLKYCLLEVFQNYKETFKEYMIYTNLEHTLDEVTPLYYKAFAKLYKCKYIRAFM